MALTLGIDIGTFESKGVLVDAAGHVLAQAARAHEMIVPPPAGPNTAHKRIGGVTLSLSPALCWPNRG